MVGGPRNWRRLTELLLHVARDGVSSSCDWCVRYGDGVAMGGRGQTEVPKSIVLRFFVLGVRLTVSTGTYCCDADGKTVDELKKKTYEIKKLITKAVVWM